MAIFHGNVSLLEDTHVRAPAQLLYPDVEDVTHPVVGYII